jgi:hypothetical protein
MTLRIEAHERNIGDVFSDAYQFEIPPYQRPYAWEKEQAKELLADLIDALDNQETNGNLYFLGSIVLVKELSDAKFKVIDGQQRLTTLTILLSVLRDLTTDQETRIERSGYVFQRASADRGLAEQYRLALRERDAAFFRKYVQRPGATNDLPDVGCLTGSQRQLAENLRFFRSKLEAIEEKRRNALTAFVVQRCFLVVISVPTTDAARRIFTVLNARGLDLSPTDILKAELLDRAGSRQEPVLAARWENIEDALGREKLVELFGHIRMIHERVKPRLDLETGFRKSVPLISKDAEMFLSDILEPISDSFLLLRSPDRIVDRFGPKAAKAVQSLARIDNKDWMPPALLRIWKSKPIENAAVSDFLEDLERLAYFLFITRAGINERLARFAAVMDEFEPRPDREATDVGISLTEDEQQSFLRVLSGPLYQLTQVCKPVMQRLDEALSSGGAKYEDPISIEHVLPQTVSEGSEWSVSFPDEQERVAWTHRLANLVFLTRRINIRASNWHFERKKKEYFSSDDGSSPFVITQGVLRTENWCPRHLEQRQRELLLKLCDVWRLNSKGIEDGIGDSDGLKSSWEFTDQRLINAKRDTLMHALALREGVKLSRERARCWNDGKRFRAVCTVAKRSHKRSSPYWYGYAFEWHQFLSGADNSFLVFGCVDRDSAYAMPAKELEKYLSDLGSTPDRHWHIELDENEFGGLDLVLRHGGRVSLNGFELKLTVTGQA